MDIRLSLLFVGLAWACFPNAAMADSVYLATGNHGEASFSDFALPDAVAVDIDVHQPSVTEAEAARSRAVETMAMAAELEGARRERETAYAERRAEAARRAARSAPAVPRYEEPAYGRLVDSSYFGGWLHGRQSRMHPRSDAGGNHREPWMPTMPEPAQPPSRGKALKWPTRRSDR